MHTDLSRLLTSGPILDSLSGFVGLSRAATASGVQRAVPAVLAGLAGRVSNPAGASALYGVLREDDGRSLGSVGTTLSSQPRYAGDDLVGHIFGSRRQSITQAVAEGAGLQPNQAAGVLAATAPLTLSFLGREQQQRSMTQAEVVGALAREADVVRADGFSSFFDRLAGGDNEQDDANFVRGFAQLREQIVAAPVSAAVAGVAPQQPEQRAWVETPPPVAPPQQPVAAPPAPEPARRGIRRWLLPLLGLVALIIAIPLLLKACAGDDDEPVAITPDPGVSSTTPPATTSPTTTAAPTATAVPTTVPEPSRFVSGGILDKVEIDGRGTEFLDLVEQSDHLATLEDDERYTLLVPTDEAMAELPDDVRNDPEAMALVVQNHVVAGQHSIDSLGDEVTTEAGERVRIRIGRLDNPAEIVRSLHGSNGTAHLIDTVLLPDLTGSTGLAGSDDDLESVNDALDLAPITFEPGSAVLTAEGSAELDRVAEYLADNDVALAVEGHTDSDGSDAANLALSQDRSQAVVDYLIAQGVAADRLVAQGFGESNPIAENSTPEGKAQNRRIEFRVIS